MPDSALPGKRVIKRFRVAREGQTVDGRALSQQQIIDMADTYDPVEYAARINCEHMSDRWRGINGGDGALGDVISVDAEIGTFKRNGVDVQLLCLYATLSALPVLVEANNEGKKLYSSIEFYPKFAGTDRAYLVGLAVTDTPASLGTEPLKFNRNEDALTTNPSEQELILMTIDNKPDIPAPTEPTNTQLNTPKTTPATVEQSDTTVKEDGFLTKLTAMFSKKTGLSEDEKEVILNGFTTVNDELTKTQDDFAEMSLNFGKLKTELDTLKQQLNNEPATNLTNIPPSTGAGAQLTDY